MKKEAEIDSSVEGYPQTGIISLLTYPIGQSYHRSTQIQGSGETFYLLTGGVSRSYYEGECVGGRYYCHLWNIWSAIPQRTFILSQGFIKKSPWVKFRRSLNLEEKLYLYFT